MQGMAKAILPYARLKQLRKGHWIFTVRLPKPIMGLHTWSYAFNAASSLEAWKRAHQWWEGTAVYQKLQEEDAECFFNCSQ